MFALHDDGIAAKITVALYWAIAPIRSWGSGIHPVMYDIANPNEANSLINRG
jgi:hypothetical protein